MPDDTNKRLETIRQRQMQKNQRAREEEARRTEMELTAALRWDTEIKPMIQQLQQEINQELEGSGIGLDVKEEFPVLPHVGLAQVFLMRDGKYTQMYLNVTLTPVGIIQVTPGDAVPSEVTSTEVREPYRDGLKAAFIDFLDAVT